VYGGESFLYDWDIYEISGPATNGCYGAVGGYSSGNNLISYLDAGETIDKNLHSQYTNIKEGSRYQLKVEAWIKDHKTNDATPNNNIRCSNVLTAGVSSAFNPNYTQNIAGASETPAPLTLGQRIGRVWGYLGTLLH